MSPDLQPGISFEWTYQVPARATVPELFHDTPMACDMPATCNRLHGGLNGISLYTRHHALCRLA